MSIKKFKQDGSKANEGVWFDFKEPDDLNKDGTWPRFLLARNAPGNKRWLAAFREATKDLPDELTPEQDVAAGIEVFCNVALLNWENIQLEDDGVNLPFSKEAAIELLSDEDWHDLYLELRSKAGDRKNYQHKEKAAKN